MRRPPFSFLLLGLLGLLAAGAAVLGILEAPTGADVFVHNDATQTLAASRLTGQYTASGEKETLHFVYVAPDSGSEKVTGPSVPSQHRKLSGSVALSLLGPVRTVLSEHGFTGHGSTFTLVSPAANLVPASQRASVTGTFDTTVTTAGGYVTSVTETVSASEAGRHVHEEVRYRLTRIGNQVVS